MQYFWLILLKRIEFMLKNYLGYLKFIDEKLNNFFEKQKPYIFCEKGCGMCCKNAQFPYSKIEMDYLMIGAWQLDLETKKQVAQKINKLLLEKSEYKGDNFKYDCPFLINDVCSVYQYRGIVCRTFGLMTQGSDGRIKVPFCCFQGYNYSNVMEDGGNKISAEKFKKSGFKEEPVAFNVSYEFLTDPDFEKGFKFEFGEKKPLIEWFISDGENQNKLL